MTPAERNRLVGILGRLGSDFDGERAAAGLLADRMIRSAGLTWSDLLQAEAPTPPPTPPAHDVARADAVGICARFADHLTVWEDNFIDGIARRPVLSAKQLRTLQNIASELQRRAGR